MMFKKGAKLFSFEIRREAGEDVAYVNYLGAPFIPSLAESPEVMGRTVDLLIASPNISRVVFVQQRNYNYDFDKIKLLAGIAQMHTFLSKKKKILSVERLASDPQLVSQKLIHILYFY